MATNMNDSTVNKPSGTPQDRRSFFRINEDLILDYRVINEETANGGKLAELFPESSMLDLFTAFRRLDNENTQLLHTIGEQNRPIADYLTNLNKKLDLLTQHIMADRNRGHSVPTTQVNLSEGGIAFASDKAIYKSSYLALRLIFIPSYVGVVLAARVIRSESSRDDRQHVAAKFLHLQDQHRQILSKHIMLAQLNAKRRAREKAS